MTSANTSSLIVVSHKLPFDLDKNENGQLTRKTLSGSLATSVFPAVVQYGGNFFT